MHARQLIEAGQSRSSMARTPSVGVRPSIARLRERLAQDYARI
jgi:hypothetical protein